MMKQTRKSFTPEEDIQLLKLIQIYGINKWENVAEFMKNRNARQCRERWKSFLNPTVVNPPWTQEEDMHLRELYAKYGPKWAKITKFFVGRSDYNVKNRWQKIKKMDMQGKDLKCVHNGDETENVDLKEKQKEDNNEMSTDKYYDEYKNHFDQQQNERNYPSQDENFSLFTDMFAWET